MPSGKNGGGCSFRTEGEGSGASKFSGGGEGSCGCHCAWQSPVELCGPVELCRPRALRKPQNKNIHPKLVLYSRLAMMSCKPLVIRCTLAIMPLLVKFRLRLRGSTPTTALRDFRCKGRCLSCNCAAKYMHHDVVDMS